MLSRLFNARLKSAEGALAQGRIDEAFRLATAADLVDEARAKKVLNQVGEQFFERSEERFKEGQYAEALADLDRAERAGVKPDRAGDLRTIIRAAADEAVRNKQSRRQRLEKARQRLADGSLIGAGQILERASHGDLDAKKLMQEAQDRKKRAVELFDEVRGYLAEGDLYRAITRFKDARNLHPKDKQASELERTLVDKVIYSAQRSLKEGRVNRAFEEIEMISGVGDGYPNKQETVAALDVLAAAARALAEGDFETARRKMLSAEHLLGGAKWIRVAGDQLKQIDEITTQLHGGPLGLVPNQHQRGAHAAVSPNQAAVPGSDPQACEQALNETLAVPGHLLGKSVLADKLLVHIDGSGSYLVLRSARGSIGRALTKSPADIPVISDLSERHAEIARIEDDYFLFANKEVRVAGQSLRQKLLQNGDKLILGKRTKLTFNLPSRKCATATLDLGGSARLPNDVKRVIMFDKLATLGRNPNSHIVVKSASEDLVLFERGDRLWIRSQTPAKGDQGRPIELGVPFEYAGVSMVIEAWRTRS